MEGEDRREGEREGGREEGGRERWNGGQMIMEREADEERREQKLYRVRERKNDPQAEC